MRRTALAFRITLALIAIILLVGVYAFTRYVDSPVTASNIAIPATTSNTVKAQTLNSTPVDVTGQYASFSYPALFTPLKQQLAPSGNILASYSYEHRAFVSWQLTITINYLPGGAITDDSAYYARVENPQRYIASTQTVNGATVTTMTDLETNGFSKIAFLFHDSDSVDISLNSQDATNIAEQQAALNQVVKSWQWK